MRALCIIALGISGYLAYTAFQMTEVFGCTGGQIVDCSHVLTSRFAKIFGVSVSVPAFAMYASLLAVLCFLGRTSVQRSASTSFSARIASAGPIESAGWSVLTVGGISAGAAALWFIGLQVFVLKHLCPYCLAVHTCGLLLAGIVLWKRAFPMRRMCCFGSAAMLPVIGMAMIQWQTPEAPTYEVVRYDDETSSENAATDSTFGDSQLTSVASADVFAPPDVFAAPGTAGAADDVFSAPVVEAPVFEAPVFDAPVIDAPITDPIVQENADDEPRPTTSITPAPQSTPVKSEASAPNADEPNVAASLLFILPVRFWNSPALHEVLIDEGNDNEASSDESSPQKEGSSEQAAAEQAAPESKPEPRLVSVAGNKFTL
ncbi:MAG: hypothetical protein KDA96_18500, partial [Planctomycetaceae bacterium]|nr:hypothetical protein [Planctomycetaceae bacterium]